MADPSCTTVGRVIHSLATQRVVKTVNVVKAVTGIKAVNVVKAVTVVKAATVVKAVTVVMKLSRLSWLPCLLQTSRPLTNCLGLGCCFHARLTATLARTPE